ncbi:MAG: glycosyltransferase [Actinomycetota bacterium]
MTKINFLSGKGDFLLLFGWVAIALVLRFANLDSKPPWTDEFSTMVFSLGNSFQGVPLDRAIALDTLLQPLKFQPDASMADVIHHLLRESNHPPIYFVLAHEWMRLWSSQDYYSLLWGARSLPALLGVASVPAIYGLGRFAFRSRLVGQCAAAMMAVSPYGIYLAQEARHYTLAILLVIASLSCLIVAVRCIHQRISLPFWVGLIWTGVNSLGVAIHYFFSLTLGAEALVLMFFLGIQFKNKTLTPRGIYSFLLPILGTLVGGLVWLPIFSANRYGSELTEWIVNESEGGFAGISPIFQALAGWITMLSLLPVESSALPVVIVSALVMIGFFWWALPILFKGVKVCYLQLETQLTTRVFGGFVLAAIALFFGFTYCLGIDLTRGARYNFVYFPATMVLVGASLAIVFNIPLINCQFFKLPPFTLTGQQAVGLILLMGLFSGVTVVSNLGYQKYYKPDQLVTIMRNNSQVPVLIATAQKTHVQTGELMGIAWEWDRKKEKKSDLKIKFLPSESPLFLLIHQQRKKPEKMILTLKETMNQLQRPRDLWLINFPDKVDLEEENCSVNSRTLPQVDGYDYQLYHCL